MTGFSLPLMLNATNSSFALATIKDRLPVILVKTIDDLVKYKTKYGNPAVDYNDIKTAISDISKLRYELMTNKPLAALVPEPDATDVDVYNEVIANFGNTDLKWFTAPWLIVECYLYRRLRNIIINCGLSNLDLFHERKAHGFHRSLPTVISMGEILEECLSSTNCNRRMQDLKLLIACALWSNEFDLSLQVGESVVEAHTGAHKLCADVNAKVADQMAVDELDAIVSRWPAPMPDQRRPTLVVVLDNTAPELFADLVLGEFVLATGLAQRVVFMPKAMPWFVSDATRGDLDWLLKEALPNSGQGVLTKWAQCWSRRFEEGSFAVELNDFWTLPFGYNEMQSRAPQLYTRLTRDSDVVIFKGDLNYRKLLEDRSWVPDSQEAKAAAFRRCFPDVSAEGGGERPLLVALRVAKADVGVGLSPARLCEILERDDQWWVKGLFGFAQLLN